MRSFSLLVLNEWLKMSKKRSFIIAYAILFAGIVGLSFLLRETGMMDQSTVMDFTAMMISTTGAGQIITIIAIIFTAGVVAREHQMGTIKFLLIRAHGRNKILASKVAAVCLFVLSLIIFSFIAALGAGALLFDMSIGDSTWMDISKGALYLTVYTMIYVTLSFMFGVLTRSSGATIGIGMGALLLEGLLRILLSRYSISKYFYFMNTDLSIYNGEVPIEGMSLTFSSVIIALYAGLFLAVSFAAFHKRDIA